MKATKQIRLLLEHVNREQADPVRLRRDLGRFVKSFDGSEVAGFIEALPEGSATGATVETRFGPVVTTWAAPAQDDPLSDQQVLAVVRLVLLKGFQDDVGGFAPRNLTFNVRNAERPRLKGARAERAYREASGVYVMQVAGPQSDLVIYLLMHLLTQPGLARLHKCKREGCDQLFVIEPVKGRPMLFCSVECRDVNRAMEKLNKKGRGR